MLYVPQDEIRTELTVEGVAGSPLRRLKHELQVCAWIDLAHCGQVRRTGSDGRRGQKMLRPGARAQEEGEGQHRLPRRVRPPALKRVASGRQVHAARSGVHPRSAPPAARCASSHATDLAMSAIAPQIRDIFRLRELSTRRARLHER